MNEFPKKIAIVGIGLIGGSIALGLKKHFGGKITILGACNDFTRAKKACREGVIDAVIDTHRSLPADTQLFILATPIKTIIKMLKILSKTHLKNCLIIDVGSTKKTIIDTAEKLLSPPTSFIGTHPMAGSEFSGFENASVNLFRNKPWIICGTKKENKDNIRLVTELILILGAKPLIMDAETHDQLTIWASHIFLVASSILVNTSAKQSDWKKIAEIASTGFRDTTRLASDNPKMKADIVLTNKINLLNVLRNLKNEINIFSQLIEQNNDQEVIQYFQKAKKIRDDWLVNYFS